MISRILLIAVLAMLLGSCGGQDNNAQKAGTAAIDEAEPDPAVVQEAAVSMPDKASVEATEPGSATVVDAVQQTGDASAGEAAYMKGCVSCHLVGAAGAPRVGDAAAWKPRIAKGEAVLVQSAMNGVPGTAMMARGACAACSDEEIVAAVKYMISRGQ